MLPIPRLRTAAFAITFSFLVGATASYLLSSLDIQVQAQTVQYARGVNRTFAAQLATGQTAAFDTFNAETHTAHVVMTGGATTCTYRLQGSNDNTTWYDISGSDITCTSTAVQHVADKPSRFVRGSLLTFSGGTSPTITLHYSGQ